MSKTADEIAGDMRAYADELEEKARHVRAAAQLLDPPKPKRRGRPPKAVVASRDQVVATAKGLELRGRRDAKLADSLTEG